MTKHDALRRRLAPYWKIELSCVALVPLVVLRSAWPGTLLETAALGLALFVVSLLLLVGGAYWLGVLKRATGQPSFLRSVLRVADAIERPTIALLGAAFVASAAALWENGWSRPVIAALSCSALGALEYVNYFRVQLQHFDSLADFKRLVSGGGFRRAHLARDLATLRKRR